MQGKDLQESAILTMGITVSNSAFMGFPIAQQIIGETARSTLAVYVSVGVPILTGRKRTLRIFNLI